MISTSANKLLKIVSTHNNDKQFKGINMRKAKIRMTKEVSAIIKTYNLTVVGDYIRFR